MAKETRAVLRDLGFRVRELRRERGLTQEAFAEKLQMLTPNYARIEQGRANVTVDTLARVARALGVEVVDLFRRPKDRNVKPGRPPTKKPARRHRH